MTDVTEARALADELVQGFAAGKPAFLEMQGLRMLGDIYGPADLDAAITAFQDRLAELTGHRTPPAPAPVPAPRAAPAAPGPADLEAMARDRIADAFQATLDGTEARLQVLAQRARGNVAHLVEQGLDPALRDRLIEAEMEQARRAWRA